MPQPDCPVIPNEECIQATSGKEKGGNMKAIMTALVALVNSPDVSNLNYYYQGKVSTFQADNRSALIEAVRKEDQYSWIPWNYCACRWDYFSLQKQLGTNSRHETKVELYRNVRVEIINPETNAKLDLVPVDWGPARWTGRSIDVSSKVMKTLHLETDQVVQFRLYRIHR